MTEIAWKKTPAYKEKTKNGSRERWKFIAGGALLVVAIAYLIIAGTSSGARYFITVNEIVNNPEYIGETVRISGAVIGETIEYDTENLIIDFTIASIPQEFENLAVALHEAVEDENSARVKIRIENEVMPDLLQHEAQAILTGALGEDGVFHASELLLKCPSRMEENGVPIEENPHGA
jgi:cytochrome c-type biogenesis protein CcmE